MPGGPNWGNPQALANRIASVIGVTSAENAQITKNIASACPGSGLVAPAVQSGAIARSATMEGFINTATPTRTKGVFYNGDQFTARIDGQGDKNRIFGRFFYFLQKDPNVAPVAGVRGYTVPFSATYPGAVFSFVRTFSPTIVNQFEAGFTRNQIADQPAKAQFGVPDVEIDTGEPQFGAYNGYPQFFNEDVFNFKDMVTIVKGNHSLKVGAEFKRNYENSEFDVGRPSIEFTDPLYFAADLPYLMAGGVNPELTGVGGTGSSHIDTNIRAWRNYEAGWFVQDDFKVTKHLTLNLGLRWDFFSPHTEKYNHATQFDLAPGTGPVTLASINCQAFVESQCIAPVGDTNTPNGGFTKASALFASRYGNFAPRLGFAWDPTGSGKTSLRGGAAISYESSFYNALSNSRWNMPFYSFNIACPICGYAGLPIYGPTDANGNPTGAAPTFSGAPNNIGQGPAALGFQGNIMGWLPSNPNLAYLTGIPNSNYRFPYTENIFFGAQHQFGESTVVEANYVGALSHHLFWAEDPNRVVGGLLTSKVTPVLNPCNGQMVSGTGLLNPCFGVLRTWETSVNSNYNALQVQANRRISHGLAFTSAYTWSHSIDFRSSWHGLTTGGSATEANPYGSSGYSLDPNHINLERGNSLFDIRHRSVSSLQWDLPWMKGQQGLSGRLLGGWEVNGILSLQSGFPMTVGAHKDYNEDGIRNDRPDTPSFGNSKSMNSCDFEANCVSGLASGQSFFTTLQGDFPAPAPGTDGNLGRNTFHGPGFADTDFSLFKKIPLGSNEARYLQFRAEFFNLFNHTNLYPPDANLVSSTFGVSTQAFDPREIQFGLKVYF